MSRSVNIQKDAMAFSNRIFRKQLITHLPMLKECVVVQYCLFYSKDMEKSHSTDVPLF